MARDASKLGELKVPRQTIEHEVDQRITLGEELLADSINNLQALDEAREAFRKWTEYNAELLERRLTTDDLAREYKMAGVQMVIGGFPSSLPEQIEDHVNDVRTKLQKMRSIRERLSLIEEEVDIVRDERTTARFPRGSSVFVVHGRDQGPRESVARLVERLGLEAVILHEQPHQGMTLIEKFEKHASTAGFAVIILTPDDEGRLQAESHQGDETELRPRARQNVIFEAGFFFGTLGRDRVALLYSPGVEKPTDVDGFAWIPLDPDDVWKLQLAKELKTAGFNVNMNKL